MKRTPSICIAISLGSFVGTLIMGLYGNSPIALVPGLVSASHIADLINSHQFTFANTMAIHLIATLVQLVLVFVPMFRQNGKWLFIRNFLYDGFPNCLRIAIPAGISLWIVMTGLIGGEFIRFDPRDGFVLLDLSHVELGNSACSAFVCLFTFLVIIIFRIYKFDFALLIGILFGTLLAIPLKVANTDMLEGKVFSWNFVANLKKYFSLDSDEGTFFLAFKGFNFPPNSAFRIFMLIYHLIILEICYGFPSRLYLAFYLALQHQERMLSHFPQLLWELELAFRL
jgi:AGZA family xanthine/uracil permease-like MFS transporter